MSQHELDQIRDAMAEVGRLEALLEAAKERRTQLATRLYQENGPQRTYMLAGDDASGGVELIVSRTKPRRDGSVSYFFAEKQRWRGAARPTGTPEAAAAAVSVQQPASPAFTYAREAPIPLTGRVVEATAALTGRAEAGEERAEGVNTVNFRGVAVQDPLKSLSAEELASVPLVTVAEIDAAIEQGRQDSEALRASRGGRRLPIVGDPAQPARPEPRLLQITEEGEPQPRPDPLSAASEKQDQALREGLALTAEQLGEPIDPDQAILDELLAGM